MPNADPSTLLEQLLAAAKERQLASTTLAAYRRAWTELLTHCAVESLDPGALSRDKAKELYQQMTRKRSASHHLQVKVSGVVFVSSARPDQSFFRLPGSALSSGSDGNAVS